MCTKLCTQHAWFLSSRSMNHSMKMLEILDLYQNWMDSSWPIPHPSTKFYLSSSFCIILLNNRQTDEKILFRGNHESIYFPSGLQFDYRSKISTFSFQMSGLLCHRTLFWQTGCDAVRRWTSSAHLPWLITLNSSCECHSVEHMSLPMPKHLTHDHLVLIGGI